MTNIVASIVHPNNDPRGVGHTESVLRSAAKPVSQHRLWMTLVGRRDHISPRSSRLIEDVLHKVSPARSRSQILCQALEDKSLEESVATNVVAAAFGLFLMSLVSLTPCFESKGCVVKEQKAANFDELQVFNKLTTIMVTYCCFSISSVYNDQSFLHKVVVVSEKNCIMCFSQIRYAFCDDRSSQSRTL